MATFGCLALASVLGAIAHGFKMSPALNLLIWQPLYLALGLTVALFVVDAVYDYAGQRWARRLLPVAIVVGVGFAVVTQVSSGSFLIFVAYEALAMLLALVLYVRLALSRRLPGATLVALGIFTTILAAAVQATHAVAFTLIWRFDHNGAFHLIQMVGLLLLIAGVWRSLAQRVSPATPAPLGV